jgi:hypothetical protein
VGEEEAEEGVKRERREKDNPSPLASCPKHELTQTFLPPLFTNRIVACRAVAK